MSGCGGGSSGSGADDQASTTNSGGASSSETASTDADGSADTSDTDSGSDADDSSTGTELVDSAGSNQACTPEQLAGQWNLAATAFGLVENEVITFDGNESIQSGVFNITIDGVALTGVVNADCSVINGAFTDLTTGIDGTFVLTRL